MLQYAIQNGIINLSYVQDTIAMKKRKEYLEAHPYKIWESDDGYVRTYLPDNNKRRLIKRKNRRDIEDVVIDYWASDHEHSFESRFRVWVNRQSLCGRSPNTIDRYWSDYNRFIKGDPIETMKVTSINEEVLAKFLRRQLSSKNVPYKTLKGLFGIINGVFKKAKIDRIIDENPCTYVDLPMMKQFCVEKDNKTAKLRTLSVEERRALISKIHRKNSVSLFAVELALYTGMRVGELAGLMWSDINTNDKTIMICHSEKYNRETGEHYISTTKNNKVRIIPLTEEMVDVLNRTKRLEMQNGWVGEYVFMNQNGRVHAGTISDSVRNNTMSEEFSSTKSIHAIRRTLNSNMKMNGVSPTVAATLLGHTVRVNNENYTYDTMDVQTKYDIMQTAGKIG